MSEPSVELGYGAANRLPSLLSAPVNPPNAGPMLQHMGAAMRQDFTGVKIFPNSSEAERLDAVAFARNDEVHFAPGHYRPETPSGRRLLGHELTHVAQQRRGRVETTAREGGTEINDEPRLEHEAERWGKHAAQSGTGAPPALSRERGGKPQRSGAQPAQMTRNRTGRPGRSASRRPKHSRTRTSSSRSRDDSEDDQPKDGSGNRRIWNRDRDSEKERQRERDRDRREEQRGRVEATLKLLETEFEAQEVEDQPESTAPPKRAFNTLVALRAEYAKATKQLDAKAPAFGSLPDVVEARKAVENLHFLSGLIENLDDQFKEARIGRRDELSGELKNLTQRQAESERNGLLLHLSTIYDADIVFWEEIWGSSANLLQDVDLGAGVDPVADYSDYKPGTSTDPIPIVWYKAPVDYSPIVIRTNQAGAKPGTYNYPNGPQTADGFPFNLVVAAGNRPKLNDPAGFQLTKQRPGSRPAQTPKKDDANKALAAAGFDLRNQAPKLDGDHVRDLGFGGADAFDNYWPLDQRINRRAFFGYNSRYVLHYQDTTTQRVKARPIGGLIGKWFTVKKFTKTNEAAVPDEAGKKKAGTDQV